MIGYVYETTNLINNKKYRGSKKSEVFLGKEYYGSGKSIKRAVKKYGIENFSVELLEEVNGSYSDLLERENYYIKDLFENYSKDLIYNISDGAFGGNTSINKTEEEKLEIRNKHNKTKLEKYGSLAWGSSTLNSEDRHKIAKKAVATKRDNGYYENLSEEVKYKCGNAFRGKHFSEKHKKNISRALKGNPKAGKGNRGKHISQEVKEKMSESAKRIDRSHYNYSHDTSPYKAMKIDSIEIESRNETVYCLSVEDTSSYIVEHAIVHNCYSYLYYAFQYMGTQRDYNDPRQPENRSPKRNNTKLKGGLCKHLTAIIEHLQAGEYYAQMAKDVTNWKNYTLGNAYRSFSRGRNMGQYNKREKEIDWKKVDSFMDNTLWAQHNFAKFLRQNNIKKSMKDEIERIRSTEGDISLDDFLEDELGLSLQELSQQIGVEEKDLDDYFKSTYGLTNDSGSGNLG